VKAVLIFKFSYKRHTEILVDVPASLNWDTTAVTVQQHVGSLKTISHASGWEP
jgi:hypothetical protein